MSTAKIKTIRIEHSKIGKDEWRVTQVTDSTEYTPRQFLTKAQVDALCASPEWKVLIVPFK